MDTLGLAGAVTLVAGVGPGLGAATAGAFAGAGAEVVISARRAESMDPVVTALRGSGLGCTALAGDMTSAASRSEVIAEIGRRFGRLDVLVYNASSTGTNAEVADADLDDWRRLMEVNLWSALALTQQAVPLLRQAGGARIVMVSAMTTRMVSARGRGGYAISKAALNQAVRTLAYELAGDGIRVNAVVPGWMETPTVASWRADPALSRHVERARELIPLGEIPTPAAVAGTIVFLASRLSEAVTGELIDANGGQYMRG